MSQSVEELSDEQIQKLIEDFKKQKITLGEELTTLQNQQAVLKDRLATHKESLKSLLSEDEIQLSDDELNEVLKNKLTNLISTLQNLTN